MKEKYECICINCSKLFLSNDEEAIYCDSCWQDLLKDFFKSIERDTFNL